jgi:hypothetical protein
VILERKVTREGVEFVTPDGENRLVTHPVRAECYQHGCVVHSPSTWALSDAPYNWRPDRSIMERICSHGVGHPDLDSADYLTRHGREHENIHACCGCCS